jgi:hypothetical protein
VNDTADERTEPDRIMAAPLSRPDVDPVRRVCDFVNVHARTHGMHAPIAVIDERGQPGGHLWELTADDLARALRAATAHLTAEGLRALPDRQGAARTGEGGQPVDASPCPEPTAAELASWEALEFDCSQAWADRLNAECERTGATPAEQLARYVALPRATDDGPGRMAGGYMHVPGQPTMAGVPLLTYLDGPRPEAAGPSLMSVEAPDSTRWIAVEVMPVGHTTYADVLAKRFGITCEPGGHPRWEVRRRGELIGRAGTELDAQRLAHRWWAGRRYPGSHLDGSATSIDSTPGIE